MLALGGDALLYLVVMVSLIAFLCTGQTVPDPVRFALIVTGVIALLFSAPYFVTFSHPTYHFPIVVLFTAFAAMFLAQPAAIGRPRLFWSAMIVLGAIQIEWVLAMGSRV